MIHGYCTTSLPGLAIGKVYVQLEYSEKAFIDTAFTISIQEPSLSDI